MATEQMRARKAITIAVLGIIALGVAGSFGFKRSNAVTASAPPKTASALNAFSTAMIEHDYAKMSRILASVKPSEKDATYWHDAGYFHASLHNYDLAIEA